VSAWPDLLPEDPNERAIFDDNAELHGSPLMAVWAQLNAASVMAPKQGSWGRYLAVMANEVRAAMIAQADLAAARAEGAEAMREVCEQAAMDEHRNREIELADMRGNKIRDVGAISFVAGGSGSAKVIASRIRALPIPAADALTKMAAPVPSHQHGGENAQQQGGEEGIASFSPPDALTRRDDGWQPFVYASPPDGLCWLLVERPETWFDAGDDGRDVGGYTGQMEMVVVLAEVYGTDTGPAFESVGYGDHGHVGDDDLVVSFIPLSAPSTPTIRARAGGEERQG